MRQQVLLPRLRSYYTEGKNEFYLIKELDLFDLVLIHIKYTHEHIPYISDVIVRYTRHMLTGAHTHPHTYPHTHTLPHTSIH